MRKFKIMLVLLLISLLALSCSQEDDPTAVIGPLMKIKDKDVYDGRHATGGIEFEWKGGNGNGSPDETKFAFVEFDAHEASGVRPPKGEFIYRIIDLGGEIHRQIEVEVSSVFIETTDDGKDLAWFSGYVVSDTKGCDGSDTPGGHSPDCHDQTGGGCSDHPDGGCTDSDHSGGGSGGGGSDGGCSDHSDGGSGGGGSDGGCSDHSDGGCTDSDHSDLSHDAGCAVDDETHEEGCSGDHSDKESGDGGQSGGISGKSCRVGQLIYTKVHDGGTPAVRGDGIKWKWFAPDSEPLDFETRFNWKLCKKTIIEGNLVVHK